MAAGVKGSTYRQRQALQTRDRIADAARLLFARDGYSATSIDAIATEAGVAVRTVIRRSVPSERSCPRSARSGSNRRVRASSPPRRWQCPILRTASVPRHTG